MFFSSSSRNGVPKCCVQTKGNCPLNSTPECDTGSNNRIVGTSYCTYSADYACYSAGWPACCSINGGANCPTTQPACDLPVPGSSYCTYSADYACYSAGWPACCSINGGATCPTTQPACDTSNNRSVGTSYCTYAPDDSCYR